MLSLSLSCATWAVAQLRLFNLPFKRAGFPACLRFLVANLDIWVSSQLSEPPDFPTVLLTRYSERNCLYLYFRNSKNTRTKPIVGSAHHRLRTAGVPSTSHLDRETLVWSKYAPLQAAQSMQGMLRYESGNISNVKWGIAPEYHGFWSRSHADKQKILVCCWLAFEAQFALHLS